jgi:hypothetical protein
MTNGWYYVGDGQPVGPLTVMDLKEKLGKLPNWRDVHIWRESFAGWQKAETVPEVTALFAKPPPVPPNIQVSSGSERERTKRIRAPGLCTSFATSANSVDEVRSFPV